MRVEDSERTGVLEGCDLVLNPLSVWGGGGSLNNVSHNPEAILHVVPYNPVTTTDMYCVTSTYSKEFKMSSITSPCSITLVLCMLF